MEDALSEANQTYPFPSLMSFVVPGLGQLLKKQFLKSIFIWAAMILLIPVLYLVYNGLYCCGHLLPFTPFAIVAILLWVWNVYDAYNA